MEYTHLGRSGLTVSALGLGCMGMSDFYGSLDDAESTRTLHRARELLADSLRPLEERLRGSGLLFVGQRHFFVSHVCGSCVGVAGNL